jgi:dTDP-4-amino-4,6-dideoxygalactose transaminase
MSRSVPFFRFSAVFEEDPEGFTEVFRRTMSAGQIILQPPLEDFEAAICAFMGARHVIGLSDGTRALELGLRALDFAPGDEVIIPSHTFVATAQAIHYATATPVPVDIGPDGMIDAKSAKEKITARTRGIMVAQLNGRTCNMDEIQAVAEAAGLPIFEDSAQALGSHFKGRYAGTFGQFGMISLYPSKLLGGFGDGGLLVTDDDDLADRVKRMRNHGANAQKQLDPAWEGWGTNSRLDTLQAALVHHKLPAFPGTLARRRQIARTYHSAFEELPDFDRPPGPDDGADHFDVYQNYEIACGRRDELRAHLQANGVGTIIQWAGYAVHQLTGLGLDASLPVTERFFTRCLLLPMNQYMSDEDVAHVCSTVRAFYGRSVWEEVATLRQGDTPPLVKAA